MKHLFFYIICFFMFFKGNAYAVEPPHFPDDFEGTLTRQYLANYLEDETFERTMVQNLNMYYEIGTYLYQKYPWEEIVQKDFVEKIRQFFPYDTDEQLHKKHDYLVKTAALYQMGRDFYVKFANKYLVPHVYRKVHDISDFDHPNEVQYIPTSDDEYAKVYNFKKFLTYSTNTDELNAISEFERKREDNDDILVQIDRIVEKIDWKKVWLYGTVYKNPLFSDLGVGEAQYGDGVNVRLLSRDTYTEGKNILDYGLQIVTHPQYFVLANNLDTNLKKPQIRLTNAENVADMQILYPMPQKTNILPQAHKYFGNFIIPLKITSQNTQNGITLKVRADLTLCDYKLNCKPQSFDLSLHSAVTGADKFDNGFDNLFFNNLRRIPDNNHSYLKIKQFTVINTNNEQQLVLETETSKKIKSFDAYIENTEGYTPFAAPRYVINGNIVQAYFQPLNTAEKTDLSNTDYLISINLNNRFFYRDNLVPKNSAETVQQFSSAPQRTMWPALLGGLLLNFMPFTAPLLLILLLLLLRISKRKPELLRRTQTAVLKGSIAGLLTTAILFISQKHTGNNVVWGIQFAHPIFVLGILFSAATLLKLRPATVSAIVKISADGGSSLPFILGFVTGLAVTATGAPYLSGLMNTAAVSSVLYAFIILMALSCGFALMQILMLYFSLQKPLWHALGNSQRRIEKFTDRALYLSILWAWLFIGFNGGFLYALWFVLIIAIWGFLCEIYQKYLNYLNGVFDADITTQQIAKIRRGSIIFMGLLLALFLSGSVILLNHRCSKLPQNTAAPITEQQVQTLLKQNTPVLMIFEADWCFKCQLKRIWTFNPLVLKQWQERYKMQIIKITQTRYLTQYMQQNAQYTLPFYILYTPQYPQGLVLDSDLDAEKLDLLLNGL